MAEALDNDTFYKNFKILKLIYDKKKTKVYIVAHQRCKDPMIMKIKETNKSDPFFKQELKIYKLLGPGFCTAKIYSKSLQGENSIITVYEQLGPNLKSLFKKNGSMFSISTIIYIGYKTLEILADLHSKNIIHGVLKPKKLLIGIGGKQKTINIIDFSRGSVGTKSKLPTYQTSNKLLTSQINKYSSSNAYFGEFYKFKDDLESLCYILIHFFTGGDWPKYSMENVSKLDKIKMLCLQKMTCSVEKMCEGAPASFVPFVETVRNMKKNDIPDYDALKKILINMLDSENIPTKEIDLITPDWIKIKLEKQKHQPPINLPMRHITEETLPIPKILPHKNMEVLREKKLNFKNVF